MNKNEPDAADPANPLEMEHELQLATYRQCDGGQDDVSLNKPLQIITLIARVAKNSLPDVTRL